MMRVKIQELREGLHPSEVVVKIDTNHGSESLVVDKRSLKDSSLEVGYPIEASDKGYLVELPRETTTGSWRVWVSENTMLK